MICSLVKSQTEINFFNEFLLGGEAKNNTKIISINKVATLSKITVDYQETTPDTSEIEEFEYYKNGFQKKYNMTDYQSNYIYRANYNYRAKKYLGGSSLYQKIVDEDTMVISFSKLYKYENNMKVKISTEGNYWNEEFIETDSTIYIYKSKNLISQQRYIQAILVYKEEYFYNRNNRLDSILFLSQDSSVRKTIYYYDNQLRLIKKIDTKSKNSLNYDTDYIFKMEYQYNDNDQIEQINHIQLSNQQEWNKITKVKYHENKQVEIWRDTGGINGEDTKEVYLFSDKLLLLKVMDYTFKNEVWELTSEETCDYTYFK